VQSPPALLPHLQLPLPLLPHLHIRVLLLLLPMQVPPGESICFSLALLIHLGCFVSW
jgi:hypothetical protein